MGVTQSHSCSGSRSMKWASQIKNKHSLQRHTLENGLQYDKMFVCVIDREKRKKERKKEKKKRTNNAFHLILNLKGTAV